jgi:alkanesulfonate monooxygenase SsuD/methylene tetrahydromethanopterin reductase-like flavin-dependent oxidoreductase (luciferase family)
MAKIGIMIEGQEGLTWDRWRRLCHDVETLGFASLRRSDHLISVLGVESRDALDCWASLALAAEWTTKIEFGPMVSPLSWHHPGVIAREAAAVDILSGGRLILGVGAGWNDAEHERFGLVLSPQKQRMLNYEAGIRQIIDAWGLSNPKPVRMDHVPLVLGGKGGERHGLRIVATYADEWNLTESDPEIYQHKREVFLEHCSAVGRDPTSVRRSILQGYLIGATEADVLERAAKVRGVFPRLQSLDPREVLRALEPMWFVGTPERIAEKMRRFIHLGVDLFMLGHWMQDDRDALEQLATVMSEVA